MCKRARGNFNYAGFLFFGHALCVNDRVNDAVLELSSSEYRGSLYRFVCRRLPFFDGQKLLARISRVLLLPRFKFLPVSSSLCPARNASNCCRPETRNPRYTRNNLYRLGRQSDICTEFVELCRRRVDRCCLNHLTHIISKDKFFISVTLFILGPFNVMEFSLLEMKISGEELNSGQVRQARVTIKGRNIEEDCAFNT